MWASITLGTGGPTLPMRAAVALLAALLGLSVWTRIATTTEATDLPKSVQSGPARSKPKGTRLGAIGWKKARGPRYFEVFFSSLSQFETVG